MSVDVVEIAQEIYRAAKRLNKSGDKLFSLAREYAEAEQEYRKALGVEIMKLREQKVPVSIVGDVARANVAEIKFNKDLAEFRYKAGRDKAQALQAEISALQTLYKRQEDVKSKGITYFKKDIKYAIQFESKKHIFISIEPDKRNCNQVCRFSKKEQKYIFDIVED